MDTSKKLHKMFKTDIYLQYSQTYMLVSASEHSRRAHRRHSIHYIYFSWRALDFTDPSQKMHRMFLFLGGTFPMMVSESLSSSESALLCTLESFPSFFDFCFVFFFSVRFRAIVRFVPT